MGAFDNHTNTIASTRLKDGPILASDQDWINAWQVNRTGEQKFHPVAPNILQTGAQTSESLFYQFLLQGNENNKTNFDRTKVRKLEQERYNLGKTQCVANSNEYSIWKNEHPEGGMPFGCPGLKRASEGGYAAGEFDIIENWLKKGAPGPNPQALAAHAMPKDPVTISKWESYLNNPSIKQKLVSRYLYEHLFRARIAFDTVPGEFYEIVRASNAPGQFPVAEIVTEVPNDAPGNNPNSVFYYRLRKMTDLITIKDHLVWEANDRILDRIQYLFNNEQPQWTAATLPDYSSRNPFLYFEQIPASIRYKFLMDNSKFILENLVRSPVCTGSYATFAMDDNFWVWFLKPDADATAQDSGPAAFSTADWDTVNDGYRVNTDFIRGEYSLIKHNEEYLTITEKKTRQIRPNGFRVDDVWDGSCLFDTKTCAPGKNRNAWLTALRHETNGSVIFGGEGGAPMSMFLYNFSNFERNFYSLSLNFKEWGGTNHKLLSWRDFMHSRIEAQDRFLSFLPEQQRTDVRRDWSSGMLGEVGVAIYPDRSLGKEQGWKEVRKSFLRLLPTSYFEENILAGVRSGDPVFASINAPDARSTFLSSLDIFVQQRFQDYVGGPSAINSLQKTNNIPQKASTREELEAIMNSVTIRYGFFNSRLPSVSYVRIMPQGWIYSIIANRRYGARNFLTDTLWARKGQTDRDYATIYRGIVGDYPNIFFDIPLEKANEFFNGLLTIQTDTDWLALRSRFMVPKNSDAFWQTVDWYHNWIAQNMPVTGGIFDLREYDNWEIPPESTGN